MCLLVGKVFSQNKLSFNLGVSTAYNFNTPLYESRASLFYPQQGYPNPSLFVSLESKVSKSTWLAEFDFRAGRYGYIIEPNSNFRFSSFAQTETASLALENHRFLKRVNIQKTKAYIILGVGFSVYNHVSTMWRRESSGYIEPYAIEWENAFDRNENIHFSPIVLTGLKLSTNLKKIGEVKYGLKYSMSINPLPKTKAQFDLNGEKFLLEYETLSHFFSIYFSVPIFNWEKNFKGNYRRVSQI